VGGANAPLGFVCEFEGEMKEMLGKK